MITDITFLTSSSYSAK